MEAALVMLALGIVMLVVPWLLAPASSREVASKSLFTSDRERRLWLWMLVVLVAIYSTLGPARMLAEALRERNLLRISFVLLLLLILGVLGRRWVATRPGRREFGVALGVVAAYLMVFLRMRSWEERTHLFEYGLVAILMYQALTERRRNGRTVPVPAVLAVATTALLGLLDEGIQAILPDRVYDARDIAFNALAGLMATTSSVAMERARRWGQRRTRRGGISGSRPPE